MNEVELSEKNPVLWGKLTAKIDRYKSLEDNIYYKISKKYI